jgi:hypothetical protein
MQVETASGVQYNLDCLNPSRLQVWHLTSLIEIRTNDCAEAWEHNERLCGSMGTQRMIVRKHGNITNDCAKAWEHNERLCESMGTQRTIVRKHGNTTNDCAEAWEHNERLCESMGTQR